MRKIIRCLAVILMVCVVEQSTHCVLPYEHYDDVRKLVVQLECDTAHTNKYKQKKLVRLNRVLMRMDRKAHWSMHPRKHEKKFAYLEKVLLAQKFLAHEQKKQELAASAFFWQKHFQDDSPAYVRQKKGMLRSEDCTYGFCPMEIGLYPDGFSW